MTKEKLEKLNSDISQMLHEAETTIELKQFIETLEVVKTRCVELHLLGNSANLNAVQKLLDLYYITVMGQINEVKNSDEISNKFLKIQEAEDNATPWQVSLKKFSAASLNK